MFYMIMSVGVLVLGYFFYAEFKRHEKAMETIHKDIQENIEVAAIEEENRTDIQGANKKVEHILKRLVDKIFKKIIVK